MTVFTFLTLCVVGFGLYRIGKFVAANPGTSIKAAGVLKNLFK